MRKIWLYFISALVIIVNLMLVAFTLLQPEAISLLEEPWSSLIHLLVFPALIQLYKFWVGRGGKVPSKRFLQITAFVISTVFTFLSGGFAGIGVPALPVMGEDIVVFFGDIVIFVRESIAVVWIAFGAQMGLYEVVLKRIFEIVGFAAPAKVASRKKVGLWA